VNKGFRWQHFPTSGLRSTTNCSQSHQQTWQITQWFSLALKTSFSAEKHTKHASCVVPFFAFLSYLTIRILLAGNRVVATRLLPIFHCVKKKKGNFLTQYTQTLAHSDSICFRRFEVFRTCDRRRQRH